MMLSRTPFKFSGGIVSQELQWRTSLSPLGWALPKAWQSKCSCLVVESGLSDPDISAILPHLKALFSVRCVFRSARDKKADRFQVLQDKFAESSRPRPDPIQVASLLAAQCHEEGGTWESHAAQLIQEFQQGSANENKTLSDLEVQIVKMVPQLDDSTRELLGYHWSNYQAKHSGLPYKLLGCDAMVKGVKPRTDDSSSSSLWTTILGLSSQGQLKRHFFIQRKIRYFCMKVAEAKRLRKKINLVPWQFDLVG